MTNHNDNEARRHNSTFAIGGVSSTADSFVVAKRSVLRINICGKNPDHRKSAKRYRSRYDDSATINDSAKK